jgi:hypothetical protein
MAHYRLYQLDHSDHITAGYSAECGSDTDALRAAGRLLAQHPATAVEVWQGAGRIGRLRAGGPWVRPTQSMDRAIYAIAQFEDSVIT